MNAREKLNQHAVWGSVIVGGIFGAASSSWIIFLLITTGLIASAYLSSDIRPRSRRRKR